MGGNKEGEMVRYRFLLFFIIGVFFFSFQGRAEEKNPVDKNQKNSSAISVSVSNVSKKQQPDTVALSNNSDDSDSKGKEKKEGMISVSFGNGTSLADALRAIADDANINIIISPEVTATVTSIELNNIYWEDAIKQIVKTYGYGYEREGNTVTIAPLDKIIERKKKEMELSQVKEVETRVYTLRYVDAGDALKVIEGLLSPRGTAEILEMTYLGGWKFVASQEQGKLEKSERKQSERKSRSKKLIVTDIKSVLKKVEAVLKEIDHMPKQVMIEANIVEVDWHKLLDLGAQLMTGTNPLGPEQISLADIGDSMRDSLQALLGGIDAITPNYYEPLSAISGAGIPEAGAGFVFRHLTGNQFTLGLRALEELADANVISAPKVLTISNQEASILVGTKYPIVSVDKEMSNGTVSIQVNLEYYQDIGVQLNVVPQICGDKFINMIVHPAVVEKMGELDLGIEEAEGNAVAYPIMDVREAETQLMIKDGDTIVIGGLMKDSDKQMTFKVPLLSEVPVLGKLFQRNVKVNSKTDLFIFVTAKIVDPTDEDIVVGDYKKVEGKILSISRAADFPASLQDTVVESKGGVE